MENTDAGSVAAAEKIGMHQNSAEGSIKGGTLTTTDLVVMIAGVQVPLGSIVSILPIAIGFGSGVGTPVTFLVSGLILLCFVVGWSRMSAHVTNAGAFYAYIAQSLGLPLGVAGAAIAVLAYNAMTIAAVGIMGAFAQGVFSSVFGIDLSWGVYALLSLVIIGMIASRKVEINARVLSVAVLLELVLIGILLVAIVWQDGLASFPLESFNPKYITGPGAGVSMAIAVWVSLGFEAGAIYGEEAKDPRRSVPRASSLAILVVTVVYVVSAWIIIGGAGGEAAGQVAAQNPTAMVFDLYEKYTGKAVADFVQIWSLISIMGACLACHNLAARYFYVLGREGLLPKVLGRVRAKNQAPLNASLCQLVIMGLLLLLCLFLGADPYLVLGSGLIGLSVIGIVGLMAVASIAIFWFFRTQQPGGVIATGLMPIISFAGLVVILFLVIGNYRILSGFESGPMLWVPALVPVVGVAAFFYALWIRAHDPEKYQKMRVSLDRL